MQASKRPLSPHLGIWRWTLTMTMSILHRASGVANVVGLLLIVWWLLAAATGSTAYEFFLGFARSPVGLAMFVGWTLSVYMHMFGGIRHLLMDMGYLLNIRNSNIAVLVIWIGAALCTGLTWLVIAGNMS